MKSTIHIRPLIISLATAAIMLLLLSSCKAVQKNVEAPQEVENGSLSLETTENNEAVEQNTEILQNAEISSSETEEPQTQPSIADEATDVGVFENNGLKLLYPSEWSLTDRTDISKHIDNNVVTEYYISRQKDPSEPRVGVRIAEDIPDGGIEKRKEEANLFFENTANTEKIVFEDIIINDCDFYKISYPYGDNFQEILLIAVKNNMRYDIWADFNKDSQEETELIDDILHSIEIFD